MSKKRRQDKIDKQKKVSKCNWGARKRSHNHIDQFFIIIVFFIIFLFIFFYYFFINFFIIFFHLIFFYYFFYLLFFLGWWSWLSPLTKLIKNKWNINKPSIACVHWWNNAIIRCVTWSEKSVRWIWNLVQWCEILSDTVSMCQVHTCQFSFSNIIKNKIGERK